MSLSTGHTDVEVMAANIDNYAALFPGNSFVGLTPTQTDVSKIDEFVQKITGIT